MKWLSWLSSPASQDDPHHWAGTYTGHMVAGLFIWVMVLNLPFGLSIWGAIMVAWGLYALAWEAVQLRLFKADLADCLLDWDAAAIGAIIGAGFWTRDLPLIGGAGMAALIVVVVGVKKRSEE